LRVINKCALSLREKVCGKKGEMSPKGIAKIPLGGLIQAFSGKSTSWPTPDGSLFQE
jgi:hypothetical protein